MLTPDPERGQPDPMLAGSEGFALRRSSVGGISAAELAARYCVAGRVPENALPAEEIQARLEGLVLMVMSVRRSLRPSAEALACFPAERVTGLIRELERVTRTSLELGYQLCVHAAEVLHAIPDADLPGFVLHLLEVYDRAGTQGCIRLMGQVSHTAEALRAERIGQSFAQVAGVLGSFTAGLAGRHLKLQVGDEVFTDTEVIHLPERLTHCQDRPGNFRLYKAMIAHQWAQVWFGTWRVPVVERLQRFPDPVRALRLFHALECIRLDGCLARELPGLWREMKSLENRPRGLALGPLWREAEQSLGTADAGVERTWAEVERFYPSAGALPPACYQGVLRPERVAAVLARRAERERRALQEILAVIADELGGVLSAPLGAPPTFRVEPRPDDSWPGGLGFQLLLGDQPVAPAGDMLQLLHSIVQDFGRIPADYLVPAGHGLYHRRHGAARDEGGAGAPPADFVYDEWDYTRQTYRKGWCRLRERDIAPEHDNFVAHTRAKHRPALKQLYRTFEALRGEDKRLRREADGEDPDIDALVESLADRIRGREMDHRLFVRRRRVERNVAVLFMVDLSGSTKGWINQVEREALVLLCESLELLGDRYAIYGFSGYTHMRCELYRVKGFDEAYDASVHARISAMRPQDYTRLGVTIRHLCGKLLAVEARTRVLIVLSDGRPDDEDGYRGTYGIEDTRQAVLEARGRGVHPFCITIDDEAQGYLPRMFGATSYVQVEDVAKLPCQVADIYRRITS